MNLLAVLRNHMIHYPLFDCSRENPETTKHIDAPPRGEIGLHLQTKSLRDRTTQTGIWLARLDPPGRRFSYIFNSSGNPKGHRPFGKLGRKTAVVPPSVHCCFRSHQSISSEENQLRRLISHLLLDRSENTFHEILLQEEEDNHGRNGRNGNCEHDLPEIKNIAAHEI